MREGCEVSHTHSEHSALDKMVDRPTSEKLGIGGVHTESSEGLEEGDVRLFAGQELGVEVPRRCGGRHTHRAVARVIYDGAEVAHWLTHTPRGGARAAHAATSRAPPESRVGVDEERRLDLVTNRER